MIDAAAALDRNSSLPAPIQQNRYALLNPTVQAEEHEWWQTAYNVAWWITLIGYTLLAVGVTVVVGITTPTYLPIATIAATFAMYPASNFAAQFTSQALAYGHLARIERSIEDIAAGLQAPNQNEYIVDPRIGGIAVPEEYRSLAGRYVYWKREAHGLIEVSNEVSNHPFCSQVAALPTSQEERQQLEQRYQADIARTPVLQRELLKENPRGNRTIAFQLKEEALRAKVYAAFCYGILVRPTFPVELENLVQFSLPALGANLDERAHETQMRIGRRGLSREFNAAPDDLLILIHRSREEVADVPLSFDQVFALTEEQLAARLVPPPW
jgi:hypothetical protein